MKEQQQPAVPLNPPKATLDRKSLQFEGKSAAQGGRWLDSDTVSAEPKRGYGIKTHHERQSAQPDVIAAAKKAKEPDVAANLELQNKARTAATGGRWIEQDNVPKDAKTQKNQPEVQQAVKAAHDPKYVERAAKEEAARRLACGGRFL